MVTEGSNNTSSSGCRRRLPTLPPTRSPRNSIGGEGCSAASLIASGQHRNPGNLSFFNSLPSSYDDNNSNQSLDAGLRDPSHGKFGWIQFSLMLEQSNVYVNVWSAQNLLMMEDEHSFSLPHPYFIVRLYSPR